MQKLVNTTDFLKRYVTIVNVCTETQKPANLRKARASWSSVTLYAESFGEDIKVHISSVSNRAHNSTVYNATMPRFTSAQRSTATWRLHAGATQQAVAWRFHTLRRTIYTQKWNVFQYITTQQITTQNSGKKKKKKKNNIAVIFYLFSGNW